jgi:hypothetical protein
VELLARTLDELDEFVVALSTRTRAEDVADTQPNQERQPPHGLLVPASRTLYSVAAVPRRSEILRFADFAEAAGQSDNESFGENGCFGEQSEEVACCDHVDDGRTGGSDLEFRAGATCQQIEFAVVPTSLKCCHDLVARRGFRSR